MDSEVEKMVLAFRVIDLKSLLSCAKKTKSGRKKELQIRVLELAKSESSPEIVSKIKELYELMPQQVVLGSQSQPVTGGASGPSPASNGIPNQTNYALPIYRQQVVLGSQYQPVTGAASGSYPASNGIPNQTNYALPIYRQQVVLGSQYQPVTGGASGSSPASNGIPNQTNASGESSDNVLQENSPSVLYNAQKSQLQPHVTIPICHGVKMKRLPFYDIKSELTGPCSLLPQHGMNRSHEASFPFRLTQQEASDIKESREYVAQTLENQNLVEIQLRFFLLDSLSITEKEDRLPPNLSVKVNSIAVPLPNLIPCNLLGVEPKRPSEPLKITNYVSLIPPAINTITVNWNSDNSQSYAMCVYLVRKLTSVDLLTRLERKGPRPADYSRGLIKELIAKDDGDCTIEMTSLKVSISCPLGKCRMSVPCRASTCKHLQCFDANFFLQMNERKPTWICPVCDKPTLFDDISIDGYFQEVIDKMSGTECMDVELFPDGSWKMLSSKAKEDKDECSPSAKKMEPDTTRMNQTINLDDDDDVVIVDPSLSVVTQFPI